MGQFPSTDAARAAYRPTLFVPPVLPAVQRALVGSDGGLWLQRFARDEWIVLDVNGRVVRTVAMPAGSGARLMSVAADRAWVATTTAAGEPQVELYSVARR
jgi:hypothetical protein